MPVVGKLIGWKPVLGRACCHVKYGTTSCKRRPLKVRKMGVQCANRQENGRRPRLSSGLDKVDYFIPMIATSFPPAIIEGSDFDLLRRASPLCAPPVWK